MKLSCNQQLLSKAINTVSKAVTARTTLPLLKGILLEADGTQLKLTASDLDLSIERIIPVTVSEPGVIVLSARLFGDIIRKLPNEEIEIETGENHMVTIRCTGSEFNIMGQKEDEFPKIGAVDDSEKLSIEKNILREMIRKTSFAASIEEAKGIIIGVLMELEENSLNLIALDGFRMAVTKEPLKNQKTARIIAAARILNEINKILGEEEENETVELVLDHKKAVFFLKDIRIVARLLEGEYIRYREILPKENSCQVKVDRGELADSIERASLMAREGKSNLIKMNISDDRLVIHSRSDEGKVREEVFIEKSGQDLEIGLNAKFLHDVLRAITDEEIRMEFNTSVSPCLIRPLEGDGFLYLILPVRMIAG
ncbi:MAG TPA: DNA polymerase III subunit beta [Clostridiales bacterium]|nr:DNA polymerase III subunit beta [Clostridiales bacterium]